MLIEIIRDNFTPQSTTGRLYADGHFICFTLEDPVRDAKIKHKTAIPEGEYKATVNVSPRFGRMMVLLLDVPNFIGVRIHSGNTAQDTSGCILVAENRGANRIWGKSRQCEQIIAEMAMEDLQEHEETIVRIRTADNITLGAVNV